MNCECGCGTDIGIGTAGRQLRFVLGHNARIRASVSHLHNRRGSRSPEYRSWAAMKTRCFNPNSPAFGNYGGRGITVCQRWVSSFSNFLSDMGLKPSAVHSIDRIENDGNYEPGNCRWATSKEQNAPGRQRPPKRRPLRDPISGRWVKS